MSKFNRALFIRQEYKPTLRQRLRPIASFLKKMPDTLWWKVIPGSTITVPWPCEMEIESPNHPTVRTTDPNDIYRPLLEAYCGRQYVGWNWRGVGERIEIKVRADKSRWATLLALRWS